jgi:hypothetical protein
MDRLRSLGVERTLQKPFAHQTLAEMLKTELSSDGPGPIGCRENPC